MSVEIVGCPTQRESSGLAMSSRNMRLNPAQKNTALIIPKLLYQLIDEAANKVQVNHLQEFSKTILNKEPDFKLEYLEFADSETLEIQTEIVRGKTRIFIAGYVGEIRLIDNMLIG
jgi:pantoate--beta-alanine ligase